MKILYIIILKLQLNKNINCSGKLGRDSTDYITWSDNAYASHFVNGNEEMRLEADGDLHVDGDVVAYSSTTASDRRLKTNITSITGSMTPLIVSMSQYTKRFSFVNPVGEHQINTGYIAQDITSGSVIK